MWFQRRNMLHRIRVEDADTVMMDPEQGVVTLLGRDNNIVQQISCSPGVDTRDLFGIIAMHLCRGNVSGNVAEVDVPSSPAEVPAGKGPVCFSEIWEKGVS